MRYSDISFPRSKQFFIRALLWNCLAVHSGFIFRSLEKKMTDGFRNCLDFETFRSFSAVSEVPYPDFLRLRNHAVPRANVLSKMQRITMRLLPLSKTYDCECNICLPHVRYGYGNDCLVFGLWRILGSRQTGTSRFSVTRTIPWQCSRLHGGFENTGSEAELVRK